MTLTFDNRITLGNILTIGSVIVGLSIGYMTIIAKQEEHDRRIELIEIASRDRRVEALAQNAATDTRLRSLEVAQAGQSADLRSIQTGIEEIKTALNRLAPRP